MSTTHHLTKREMLELVWSEPMTSLAQRFGLSANGLAKICDRLEIERPPKGFWRAGAEVDLKTLIAQLENPDEQVSIGGGVSGSRRSRTRMSPDERRRQVLDEARRIAVTQGVHEVGLRAIARNLGISEAQAHNCFSTREDLLEELADEEQRAFEAVRLAAITRGRNRVTKIVMSSVSYLREAARRGPLLTQILADSNIRKRVQQRQKRWRSEALRKHVQVVVQDTNTSEQQAILRTRMLTSMIKEAGYLVAENKILLSSAERLSVPIIIDVAMQANEAVSTPR